MKKNLFLLIILSVIVSNSFAQSFKDESKFTLGIDAGLPVGSATDYAKFGIGGDLKYGWPVSKGFFINASAGYTTLIGKSVDIPAYNSLTFTIKAANICAIPVKMGAKFYADDTKGFYVEGEAGAAIFVSGLSSVGFAYSPGIGYSFGGIETGIRYEGWVKSGTVGQVALRVAFKLN